MALWMKVSSVSVMTASLGDRSGQVCICDEDHARRGVEGGD